MNRSSVGRPPSVGSLSTRAGDIEPQVNSGSQVPLPGKYCHTLAIRQAVHACRLLDEINAAPDRWRQRLVAG